ncbi:hypothetical protein PDESU_05323 [Pontiella desulfatans]|uniref:Peptidase S74 domain-containing protein n=1 Tax=Pontiella desulfatans TaxID=2750659 RepID=A0A6C2U9E6_PONDE|nr:tail fiber domain-containing protein [Pontiella desulfatans]VGO16732.1 hypothetical protein PDESU_05323 [Pontiella desulfatans]
MKKHVIYYLLSVLSGTAFVQETQAQSSAFTYQGRLTDGSTPASGNYDFRFTLYDSTNLLGAIVAGPVDLMAIPVSNGLFTVAPDFGDGVFTGADRWLEIGVRSNGTASAFTALSARQSITAAPYALHAASVNGSDILGLVPNNRLPGNLVRSDVPLIELENQVIFRGPVEFDNPSGPPFAVVSGADMVAGLNAERLGDRTAQGFWQTGGNAGTTPGPDFIGTTDNQPLEFRVNGLRALRLECNTESGETPDGIPDGAPNVIAGAPNNWVATGVVGATISGGGATNRFSFAAPNSVLVDFGTIGGGFGNSIETAAFDATIGGGGGNRVESFSQQASISGGWNNRILSGAEYTTICGGGGNMIGSNADGGTIGGGIGNEIQTEGYPPTPYGTISGGKDNVILPSASGSTISGGENNTVGTNAPHSTIAGGESNTIKTDAGHSFIAGGEGNLIESVATYNTIGGGSYNSIGTRADGSTIGGGVQNRMYTADKATIGGGESNTINTYAYGSTISGGASNIIDTDAQFATIPGGYQNHAGGYFSLAAGLRAKADHDGAFVWADHTNADFASTRANEFAVRANGGVRIDSGSGPGITLNAANRPLVTRLHDPFTSGNNEGAGRWGVFMEPHALVLGMPAIAGKTVRIGKYNADSTYTSLMTLDQSGNMTITGAYSPTSDRNAKENFADISPAEVLEKVAALPISRWNFKQDAGAEHVGPMAQDFHAAFGLGTDDKHIATVDADGVALAAIQGLHMILKEKEARICELETRLASLEVLIQTMGSNVANTENQK